MATSTAGAGRLLLGGALLSLVTACASSGPDELEAKLTRLVEAKKCDEAEALARANPDRFEGGPAKMTRAVGGIYYYCGRKKQGIAYLQLAARQGDQKAAETLIDIGESVPPADRVVPQAAAPAKAPAPQPPPRAAVDTTPIPPVLNPMTTCRRNGPTVQCF